MIIEELAQEGQGTARAQSQMSFQAFIEAKFNPAAPDYTKEFKRILELYNKKYPDQTRPNSLLVVIKCCRRQLAIRGKSGSINKLYLPMAFAFMQNHRGPVAEGDIFNWANEAKNRYGFRNVTPEKIKSALDELNGREDLGWKDRIHFNKLPNIAFNEGLSSGFGQRLPKEDDIRTGLIKILANNEEFRGWEEKVSIKRLVEVLNEQDISAATPKTVSARMGTLRNKIPEELKR